MKEKTFSNARQEAEDSFDLRNNKKYHSQMFYNESDASIDNI